MERKASSACPSQVLLPVIRLNSVSRAFPFPLRRANVVASKNEKDSARFQLDSEDRFHRSLDAMGDGIWDWDLQTGEVFYSDRWLESLGYHRDDARPDLSFVEGITHPEDGEILSQAGTAHLEGKTDYFECEYRLRKKSGDYRWTLGRGRVLERVVSQNWIVSNLTLPRGSSGSEVRRVFDAARGDHDLGGREKPR